MTADQAVDPSNGCYDDHPSGPSHDHLDLALVRSLPDTDSKYRLGSLFWRHVKLLQSIFL